MVALIYPLIKLKLDYCNFLSIPRLLTESICHSFRKELDKPRVWALVLTFCAWCSSPEKKLFTLAGFWRSEWDLLVKLRLLKHSVFLVFLCEWIIFQINFTGLWRSTGLLVLLDSKCQPTPDECFLTYALWVELPWSIKIYQAIKVSLGCLYNGKVCGLFFFPENLYTVSPHVFKNPENVPSPLKLFEEWH